MARGRAADAYPADLCRSEGRRRLKGLAGLKVNLVSGLMEGWGPHGVSDLEFGLRTRGRRGSCTVILPWLLRNRFDLQISRALPMQAGPCCITYAECCQLNITPISLSPNQESSDPKSSINNPIDPKSSINNPINPKLSPTSSKLPGSSGRSSTSSSARRNKAQPLLASLYWLGFRIEFGA